MINIPGVNPLCPITMTSVEAGHALFQVIKDGKEQEVQHLLALGADVTVKNKDGDTPLVMAGNKGDLGIVKLLLEAKADPNQKFPGTGGQTVFSDACYDGNISLCELLIEYGADPHALLDDCQNGLHTAVVRGHHALLGFLLQLGLNPDQADDYGNTPLHKAAHKGDIAACALLASHKANINAVNKQKNTPLLVAGFNKQWDVCSFLIAHGADPNLRNEEGIGPLHDAACHGQIDVCRLLLDHGANIDLLGPNNTTALALSVCGKQIPTALYLLQSGASPHQVTVLQETLLHLAAKIGSLAACVLLTGTQKDMEAINIEGQTPLYIAALKGDVEVCQCLLSQGANPNTCDKENQSPLQLAANRGDIAVCQILLSYGAEINRVGTQGFTPLMFAVANNQIPTALYLLHKGANPHATTAKQETALHLAAVNEQASAVPLLLQHGINPIALDYQYDTALGIFLDHTTERPEALVLCDAGFTDTLKGIRKLTNTFSAKFAKLNGGSIRKAFADLQASLRLYLHDHILPEEVVDALLSTDAIKARLSEGAPVCLMTGWFGHGTAVVIWGKLLCRCNRAYGARETGIQIFEIGQGEKVLEAVERLMSNTTKKESEREATIHFFFDEINTLLELKHLYTYKMLSQRTGNCHLLAPRLAFRALLQLYFYKKNLSFAEACKEAKELYSAWHQFDNQLVLATADPLFDALERDPRFVGVIDISALARSILKANLYKNRPLLEDWLNKRFPQLQTVTGAKQRTLLCKASQDKLTYTVKRLLELSSSAVNIPDKFGQMPLHYAAFNGSIEICESLLKHGANPNIPDAIGLMPLHGAISLGSVEMCQLLLERGARANEPFPSVGWMPLYLAASREHKKICELLIAKDAILGESIPLAVSEPETINCLLEAGMDPNMTYNGWPLLVMAMTLKQTVVVRLLLAYRAKPNAQADNGTTALHVAAKNGDEEMCTLLIEDGADPTIKDEEGRTPLDMLQEEHAHLIPILTPKG